MQTIILHPLQQTTMAKQKGQVKLEGKIDDLLAYNLNGEWIIRKKSNISKQRYKKDPAYQQMRESSKEFGGASTISKYLRTPWKKFSINDKDATFHFKLNAIILKCIHNGDGDRGKRTFTWNNAREDFKNININKSDAPSLFISNQPSIEIQNGNANCSTQQLKLSNPPTGTTHFKLSIQLNQIANFVFNEPLKMYTPTQTERQQVNFDLPITEINQPLSTSLTQANLPLNSYWTVITTIQFLQEVNGDLNKLSAHPLELTQIIKDIP